MLRQRKSIFKPRKTIKYNYYLIDYFIQEIQHLGSRLFIQAARRPSHVISGLIQPLLWLTLFGSLFRNIPLNLFHLKYEYTQFLSCGILVFTCFTGALNTGLPLIFDREFGFLNRLLVSPLRSKNTILFASIIFIVCITMAQNCIVLIFSLKSFPDSINCHKIQLILLLSVLLTIIISSFSLGLAFILPGHIEFLACILVINLPTLFTSTALAPNYLMPYWLQVISKWNILTYAIEAIRFITLHDADRSFIIEILGKNLGLVDIYLLLICLNLISFITITSVINNKLE